MSTTEKFKEVLIKCIKKEKANITQTSDLLFNLISNVGYVIPMVVRQAIRMGNEIIDNIPYRSSADHGTNLKVLLTFMNKSFESYNKEQMENFNPYFDKHIVIDPLVEKIYNNMYNEIYLDNILISIEEGYWNVTCEDNLKIISLSEQMRRSALNLLSEKAIYLSLSTDNKKQLDRGYDNVDYIQLTQSIGASQLEPLIKGTKKAWSNFLSKVNLNMEVMIEFITFFEYLKQEVSLIWHQKNHLWELWNEYINKYSQQEITRELFSRVLDFFSVSIKEAIKWGISIPFIKIGQCFCIWPFYHHVLHPNLSLLTLLIRKYSIEWSQTVGSQLAMVSNYLADKLPSFSNIIITTLKKKKEIGDIDLGIYNKDSKHLLICEIKTVYDRFRTNYQLTNYTNQRVNFRKANDQLETIENAILNNLWNLSEIFGENLAHPPKIITKIILTWWDTFNLNLGTNYDDIICCNFKTFQYLYSKVNGNLELLKDTIYQLSKIHCIAYLKKSFFSNSKNGNIRLQIQSDILPPLSYMENKNICILAMEELKTLAHLKENFESNNTNNNSVEKLHIFPIPVF